MRGIDDYIENIYRDFDQEDDETKILKEEMKSHLYDKVNDLVKEGCSEEEGIRLAINSFGDESSVSRDMKSIIVKQKKYTNVLLRISIAILIIGFLSKVLAWNAENQYMDTWNKTRAVTSNDVMDKIKEAISGKSELQEDDKKNIDGILNNYNDIYDNGLYNVKILKNNVVYYEYSRKVSEDMIKNSGVGNTSSDNGWEIQRKQTDRDEYKDALVWQRMFDIRYDSNSAHFKLNNLGFWLISLSWVLMVMYYTQSGILRGNLSKNKVIVLALQTIVIFAVFTSDKDIILPTVVVFMLCNSIYSGVGNKLHIKGRELV